ncbi:MAG: actin-binding WH2 domain-containing protein [Cyanobacteriota bacterium]|nr:actin-binding WH2 domain-containing protein [Cyanobacteriota bacterium]
MNHFSVLMQFLRDRAQFLEEIRDRRRLDRKIASLLICSCLFFALYGAIMGSYSGGLQMLASAAKLPALYLLTLLICLPSLFFFEVVSGSKYSFAQYQALLLVAMSSMGIILFGFAPISLFFRLSVGDYTFFKLLNVVILAIAGVLGIQFFYRSAIALREKESEPPKHRPSVLQAWLILYAFVGSQLGWTLRPFFGSPGLEFQLFRNLESNFYAHLLKIINNVF